MGDFDLFQPAIIAGRRGGLVFVQGSARIVVEEGEVERFLERARRIRSQQVAEDCRRIADECRGFDNGG